MLVNKRTLYTIAKIGFTMLPFMLPQAMQIGVVGVFCNLIKYIDVGIILLWYLVPGLRWKELFSLIGCIFILFYIGQLLASYFNDLPLYYDVRELIWAIVFIFLVQHYLIVKPYYFTKYMVVWLTLISIIGFFAVCVNYTVDLSAIKQSAYLFGNRSNYALPFILAIYVTKIYGNTDKRNYYFVVFLTIIGTVLLQLSTAIVGLAIYFIVNLLFDKFKIRINAYIAILITAIVNILIITGRNVPIINYIVINILGKDATFTGRDIIWAEAIQKWLFSDIIWGKGNFAAIGKVGWLDGWLADYNSSGQLLAHNFYLDVALTGGLFCLIVVILCAIIVARKIVYIKQNNNVAVAVFFSYLIMTITGTLAPYTYWMLLYILLYNQNYLQESIKQDYLLINEKRENNTIYNEKINDSVYLSKKRKWG